MNRLKTALFEKIPLMKHIGCYESFISIFDYSGLNSFGEKVLEDKDTFNITSRLDKRRRTIEKRLSLFIQF